MMTDADAPKPQEVPDDKVSLAPDHAQAEPELAGPPWKKIALVLGSVVVVAGSVGIAAIATLAATHKSAVRANARAYVNGHLDGFRTGYGDGLVDGIRQYEDLTLY